MWHENPPIFQKFNGQNLNTENPAIFLRENGFC
jgi:hypothetical protein